MPALNSIACLIEAAELAPGKPAVVEGDRSVTFGELYQRVRQLAKGFIAAGFKHGERFAIWAPNSIDWQVAALAGHMVGCALVPLNTRYKGGEVEDILNRSACRGIFYAAEFLGVRYADMLAGMDTPRLRHRVDLDALREWMPTAGTVGDAELQERAVRVGPDTLADVLYTSGTTGTPKGVMCSHGQNIRVFATWSRSVALGEHDEYLVINPYFHSFGYKAGWLAALINRVTVHPVPVFDLDECLRLIEARRISFLPGPPTVFRSLLDHPERGRYDLGSLRCAVTGAASVPVQLVRDMKHLLGFAAVYTAYGLTESTGVVSICKPGDDFETIATTCGRPMDDIEVMIADTDGSPQPAGALGEIWVRGYNVMQGYLDDAKATAEAITEDGWLKTGDIGLMTESHYLARYGSRQRHVHLRRVQLLSGGNREHSARPSRYRRYSRGWGARCAYGRSRTCPCRTPVRTCRRRPGHHRLGEGKHGKLQGSAFCHLCGRAAAQRLRESTEIQVTGRPTLTHGHHQG